MSKVKNISSFLLWTAIFTLAYAQSPLYTSNQNQYFLHGLARAGLGYLHEDWLANTIDPTPVFSKLIEISWQALSWQPIFYLYFAVLAGVFIFSLFGIANQLWGIGASRPKKWLYLSTLIALFSAGLRYLTAHLFGLNWEYLFDGGVAGQRLLGTVFQPSTFGVFLILSIFLFLHGNRVWAVICLLTAATFHPTYLLSAGILTAVFMGITFWETRSVRGPLFIGLGALAGISPILWHTLNTFGGTASDISAQARRVLVTYRIPHHAIVADWFNLSVLVKLVFMGLAVVILWMERPSLVSPSIQSDSSALVRWKNLKFKLFHIILWPASIAVLLTLFQVLTQNNTLALLFPWRLSTWLVPLCVALVAGWVVQWLFEHFPLASYDRWIMIFSAILTIIFTIFGIAKFKLLWNEKQDLGDRPMMAYVESTKQSGETYLIHLKMQDFRLETGAPAYIEFKSIPYPDVDVLEWRRRVDFTRSFYAQTRCKKINEWTQTEGITHLVLPAGHETGECKQVEAVYLDEDYGVYTIKEP